MTEKNEYKGLRNLLAGPFYQCWNEYDNRSPEEIIDSSISELKSDEIQEALSDLKYIFKLISERVDFGYILGRLAGCNYDPNYDGITDVEWLVGLKNKLEEAKKGE